MNRLLRNILIGIAPVAIFLAILTNTTKFVYVHWQSPDTPLQLNDRDRPIMKFAHDDDPSSVDNELIGTDTSRISPKAVVDNPEHDFGVMNPLQMATHSFVIRNDGEAPLKLTKGKTTCKCTMSNLENDEVPPGLEATIVLDWKTGQEALFSHSATIHTNDPKKPEVDLLVKGKVLALVGVYPGNIEFPRLEPHREFKTPLIVYSEVWDDFEVKSINTNIEGLSWELVPAAEEDRDRFGAKSAKQLNLTLAAGILQRDFEGILQFEFAPAAESVHDIKLEKDLTYDLPIRGHVLRRLSMYGKDMGVTGGVTLDRISQGTARKTSVLMKVRDEQTELPVATIETSPEFLKADITTVKDGLYVMKIEVPDHAPACAHSGVNMARIVVRFDHPRIKEILVPVEFIVVDDRVSLLE